MSYSGMMLSATERREFTEGENAALYGIPYNPNKPLQWRAGWCLKSQTIHQGKWRQVMRCKNSQREFRR